MVRINTLIFWVFICIIALTGCAETEDLNTQNNIDELIKLNSELSRSMIVNRDKTLFDELAVDNFRVLAPGGVTENKAQVIRGLSAWDVVDIEISNEEVAFHGDIAVLTNRLDIDGTMQPIGRWGPLKSMRVFKFENNKWRLVSQSLTPCLPKAIEVGRC